MYMYVSMNRKYHTHKRQKNPWHYEEETYSNHKTPGRQNKQSPNEVGLLLPSITRSNYVCYSISRRSVFISKTTGKYLLLLLHFLYFNSPKRIGNGFDLYYIFLRSSLPSESTRPIVCTPYLTSRKRGKKTDCALHSLLLSLQNTVKRLIVCTPFIPIKSPRGRGEICQYLVMLYLVHNLVFQLSRWGRKWWLLYLPLCWLMAICFLCLFVTVLWVGLHWVIVGFPGHTHMHFGHSLFITVKINQLFCVSCLTVCQCTQTVVYLTTIIAIADL